MADEGQNMTDLMKKIQGAIQTIKGLKTEREETNAAIAEVRASMEAVGIPKPAFDMALRYLGWEPEKREGFDLAYAIVREAGGLPIAEDLFSAAARLEKEQSEKLAEAQKQTDADAIKRREMQEAEKVFDSSKALGGKGKANGAEAAA